MPKTILSTVIGELRQDAKWSDWWNKENVAIPFFNGQKLPITYMDFDPEVDLTFLQQADEALRSFLSKGNEERLQISEHVYENLDTIRREVDDSYWTEPIRQLQTPQEVWKYVHPLGINITRRPYGEQDIYIDITCKCEWEEEHGLQLVFRQGKKLTRVSQIDGHLTDSDAYDIPDEQDDLLSKF